MTMRYQLISVRKAVPFSKVGETICVGRDLVKQELSSTAVGNVVWSNPCERIENAQ